MSPAQQFLTMRAGGFLAVLILTLIDTTTYRGLIAGHWFNRLCYNIIAMMLRLRLTELTASLPLPSDSKSNSSALKSPLCILRYNQSIAIGWRFHADTKGSKSMYRSR